EGGGVGRGGGLGGRVGTGRGGDRDLLRWARLGIGELDLGGRHLLRRREGIDRRRRGRPRRRGRRRLARRAELDARRLRLRGHGGAGLRRRGRSVLCRRLGRWRRRRRRRFGRRRGGGRLGSDRRGRDAHRTRERLLVALGLDHLAVERGQGQPVVARERAEGVRVGRRGRAGLRRGEARFVGGRARRQRGLDRDDGAELLQLGRQRLR